MSGAEIEVGHQVGRYVILARIGAGGMGVVYAAYDPQLDRKVALKLLRVDAVKPADLAAAQARLLREAQAMARLSHPNVVAAHDAGTFESQVFVAMDFVEGETVAKWLERKPAREDVVDVFIQAGRGLVAAHVAGLVHGDFKPDNVLLGKDGSVRVTDFGLARLAAEVPAAAGPGAAAPAAAAPASPASGGAVSTPATPPAPSTTVVGTPEYMAPEQFRGEVTDARTDQFNFSVALYEALYGERPFAGQDLLPLLKILVQSGEVRDPPRGSDVPPWLRRVLLRGLRPNPAERYPSLSDLLTELRRDPTIRRRRLLAGAAALGVLVLAALGVRSVLDHRRLFCQAGPEKLAGIWDPARKRAVEAALLGTGKLFASEAWHLVERAVDEYAARWKAGYTEACEATHRRGEQSEAVLDLRMSCLQGRLQNVKALADVLATGDAQVAQKAVQAAQGLPLLATCADVPALESAVPPPDDPRVRAGVETLRAGLARVKALGDAGKYREGTTQAESLATQAHATGYLPVEAEALVQVGRLRSLLGDSKAAREALLHAVRVGEAAREDEAAARAAIEVVLIVGYDLAHYDEANLLTEHAEALLARVGNRPDLEVLLLNNGSNVLYAQAKYGEARARCERALAIQEKTVGKDAPDVAVSLNNIANAFYSEGKFAEARARYERALAIRQKALGPNHPDIALFVNNLANVLEDEKNYPAARARYEQGVAILENAVGPQHVSLAPMLSSLGLVLRAEGKRAEARAMAERALALWEKARGPDHPDLAIALNNLGNLSKAEGKYAEAEAELGRALAVQTKALGPKHPDVAGSLTNLGEVYRAEERPAEARTRFTEALAIYEKVLGPDHPNVASVLFNLGEVSLATGKPAEARPLFERSRAILEKAFGPDHPAVASALTGLARTDLAARRPGDATLRLERALHILDAHPDDPAALAETRFALAQALIATHGDTGRALDLGRKARDGYAAAGDTQKKALARVTAWLAKEGR